MILLLLSRRTKGGGGYWLHSQFKEFYQYLCKKINLLESWMINEVKNNIVSYIYRLQSIHRVILNQKDIQNKNKNDLSNESSISIEK